MNTIIKIEKIRKNYNEKFEALKEVSLSIQEGEILALLGPNGAGKTTLIHIICGLVKKTSGVVFFQGEDLDLNRSLRQRIGLVPQELSMNMFDFVEDSIQFSRGLFGCQSNPLFIENLMKRLSLWEKRKNKIMTLSGGMKRRVLIAKALSHEPKVLFLDEPTAGVDIELRKGMWEQIRELKKSGMTVILTTHYLEEAEELADRIGILHKGELVVVEEKKQMISRLGEKTLTIDLVQELSDIPIELQSFGLKKKGLQLFYTYKPEDQISSGFLLNELNRLGIRFKDLNTRQSSLEDIFVRLIGELR